MSVTSQGHYGFQFSGCWLIFSVYILMSFDFPFVRLFGEIQWSKCQKHFYVTHWQKNILTFLLTSLSLYIFTIWKCIVYHRLCRDGIYFDKILVSEYKHIPASPAYCVYISQLIRYARASSNYSDFLKHHLHLRNRLLDQSY
jgi:hypothetical protein